MDLANMKPSKVRELIRNGKIEGNTAGMCKGFVQGNLVILPKKYAYDFLLFANRNPKACPILEVSDMGSKEFKEMAEGSDLTRDISMYRIYKDGVLHKEASDVSEYMKDDYISFLLGCSFTFEGALMDYGIRIRHIDDGKNVPMYKTNLKCKTAGVFSGSMVVSMRPIPYNQVTDAVKITSRYPRVHGAPIHIGKPEMIGIDDINNPDFGDAVDIKENEVPVFWACGVTSQLVAMESKPDIMITHSPGHMFIADIKNTDLISI